MPGCDEHRFMGMRSARLWVASWLLWWGLAACIVPASPPPPLPSAPVDPGAAAAKLEFDVPVTGELGPTTRHRFLLKHTSQGELLLRLSWNDQDGLDRVLVQGGTLSEIMVIDTRERFKLEKRLSLAPGFYTIELVPGSRAATFNLVLNQAR